MTVASDERTLAECVAHARELERLGRHAQARVEFEVALRMPGTRPHGHTAAALLRWIGKTYRAEGDVGAALDCYHASLASAEAARDCGDRAHALNWLGVVAQEQGNADRAAELYDSARGLAEEAGDTRLVALIMQNLGVLATIQDEPERALAFYGMSLERVRLLADGTAAATLLNNLGILHMRLEQWAEATAAFDESAAASDEVGDLHIRAMVEVNRIDLNYRRGDLSAALLHCHRARLMAARVEHQVALGETYRWFGTLDRARGRPDTAEAYLAAAADVAGRFENGLLGAETQRELALLFREQGRNQEALLALSKAHVVFREMRAAPLLQDVEGALNELEAIYLDVVRRWGESIEEKDRYTSGHCQRVADYACRLARAAGLDEITLKWFRMGALLHDVGKIAIPESVLNKAGALTPEERAIIERHPVVGDEMLASMSFPWDIRPMVRGHHERWDGTGYPDRLCGSNIPVAARILCIADVFDALTTTRSYRPAFDRGAAMEIMHREAGRMFDPELFSLFANGNDAMVFASSSVT